MASFMHRLSGLVLWLGLGVLAPTALAASAGPDNANERALENAQGQPFQTIPGEATYWPGGVDAFDHLRLPIQMRRGLVNEIDFAGPVVTIEGVRYAFSIRAEVRLLSGAGAPTLLRPGMAVEFYFSPPERGDVGGTIHAAIEFPLDEFEPE